MKASKNRDGTWNADVYQLDLRQGTWSYLKPVSPDSICGRTSDIHVNTTTTAIFLPDSAYIGIARMFNRSELCQTLVKVESTLNKGVFVSVYNQDITTKLYGSYTKSATDKNGFACVTHPCGSRIHITIDSVIDFKPKKTKLVETRGGRIQNRKVLIIDTPDAIYNKNGPTHALVYDTCNAKKGKHFIFKEVRGSARPDSFEIMGEPFYKFFETSVTDVVQACMIKLNVTVSRPLPFE